MVSTLTVARRIILCFLSVHRREGFSGENKYEERDVIANTTISRCDWHPVHVLQSKVYTSKSVI